MSDEHSGELGILFLHHKVDRITRANLESVRKQNPGATLVTMSADKKFRDGYNLDATPEIQKLHAAIPRRGSDWLVCSWFTQHRERCKKWWIIEWDTFCAVPAREYYRAVWDFPFVASSVRLPHREPEWNWFRHIADLPEQLQPYALGAVPFLYLVSERALECICRALLKEPFTAGNGELRFSTVANASGFAPCGFSPPGDGITWTPWTSPPKSAVILHPVKQVLGRKMA
jgi:hypothetical protein